MPHTMLLTLASALLQPPGFFLALVLVSLVLLVLGLRTLGWSLLLAACFGLYLSATGAGARWLVMPLENRYPPLPHLQPGVGAIVVLGGGEVARPPGDGGDMANARTLMRLQAAAKLAKLSGLPIVPSGGAPRYGAPPEAATMARLLRQSFAVDNPIWIEGKSFNTAANAYDSKKLLAGHGIQRVYLVTSALHMPRAMAWFRRAGLDPIPVPCDYRLDRNLGSGYESWLPRAIYLEASSEAIHEYLGLFWLHLQERGWVRGRANSRQ
ncbi:YdcF family protein [Acidithiobacillus sp.]|uniref:YdcF family protein n=1 Tax=Acidithiobacillus sp. TaxID=1872118 RepID=UPI00345DFE7E